MENKTNELEGLVYTSHDGIYRVGTTDERRISSRAIEYGGAPCIFNNHLLIARSVGWLGWKINDLTSGKEIVRVEDN